MIGNVVAIAVLAGSTMFLAFKAGELRGEVKGRKTGYQMARVECDEDRPRYATGGRGK